MVDIESARTRIANSKKDPRPITVRILLTAFFVASMAGVIGPTHASGTADFMVNFQDCTEFVGVTEVDRKKAAALVPSPFHARSFSAGNHQASIVVRVSNCNSVSVDGGPPRHGTVAHVGINIKDHEAGAFITNYTLTYASDHPELVTKLQAAGVPADFDANLFYKFAPSSPPTGNLFAAITPENTPQWFVQGPTGNSFGPGALFIADWWRAGVGYETQMRTVIDSIEFFDASGVSFHTSLSNFIGDLIGSDTIPTFEELPVRGKFTSATMQVTVQ